MSFLGTLIIICLGSLFVLMGAKGYYHFEYLRRLSPEKLNEFGNIFETAKSKFYNENALLMTFPIFKRYKKKENDDTIKMLGDRTYLLCR